MKRLIGAVLAAARVVASVLLDGGDHLDAVAALHEALGVVRDVQVELALLHRLEAALVVVEVRERHVAAVDVQALVLQPLLEHHLAGLGAVHADAEPLVVRGRLELAVERVERADLRAVEDGAAEDVGLRALRHIGAGGHDAEQVHVQLVVGERGHGVVERDLLELHIAALFVEVAQLVGHDGGGDLDELARHAAHEVLALALGQVVLGRLVGRPLGLRLGLGRLAAAAGKAEAQHGSRRHARERAETTSRKVHSASSSSIGTVEATAPRKLHPASLIGYRILLDLIL